MPTRKQRRRREKTFRHDYGFVTYDEDGNEIEVESSQIRERKPEKAKATAAKKGGGKTTRASREPPLPSWRRSTRRGALWGGVMLLVVVFVFTSMPLPSRIFLGVLYALAFIPLTYWIDRMSYRNWQRRTAKGNN
jgi:hypothetical protein